MSPLSRSTGRIVSGSLIVGVGCTFVLPAAAQPAPALPSADHARVIQLEAELSTMQARQDELASTLKTMISKYAANPAPGVAFSVLGVPIRLYANVNLRYDYSVNSDLTDTLSDNIQANGLRMRVRLGVDLGAEGVLIGGVRFSTGENPNPTVPFLALGDAFRPASFGLDQAWFTVRPFAERERLQITLGRMKNPFWRGTTGTFRSELVWDDDVNPAGGAITAQFYKSSSIKVENTVAYYQVQELLDQRFAGLAGVTSGFGDQLRFLSKYVDGAVAIYSWRNLNAGLSVPAAAPKEGFVSPQLAAPAVLLGPGLQQTNSKVNFGPGGAIGFLDSSYHILNPTLQLHLPIKNDTAGDPDVFVLVDYAHNFLRKHPVDVQGNVPTGPGAADLHNAKSYTDGVGATLGARLGDQTYARSFHPLNVWVTYRKVETDATLATFADSDLGAGTGYSGFELGTSYRIVKFLQAQVSYFDFRGYPHEENHVQRLFLDLMGDF